MKITRAVLAAISMLSAPFASAECPDFSPTRNAYFGDLHVHTALSADAVGYDVKTRPDDAYRFAFEQWVMLPPLDEQENPTRRHESRRPLDFMAVTDHAEFLGEVGICTQPGTPGSDSEVCQAMHSSVGENPLTLTWTIISPFPSHDEETCGNDLSRCKKSLASLWQETQQAAHRWNRSCDRTTFVAYEYSSFRLGSNLHRNVIFRGESVLESPISHVDAPTDFELWQGLSEGCLDRGDGCDVLAIPHNMNISNGRMFSINYPGAWSRQAKADLASLRMRIEPIVEIMQHKGDSECRNGLPGVQGGVDEFCDFEKMEDTIFRGDEGEIDVSECYEGPGADWIPHLGPNCLSRQSYARTALIEGLRQEEEIGVNPFKFGLSASTDTHGGIGGAVDEDNFPGHLGIGDGTPGTRSARRDGTGGISTNPGGLIGVWARENTRDEIFDAMRRREVFGTSGPRMKVRLHGGWDLPAGLCSDPNRIESADANGVPMGSDLPASPASRAPSSGGPRFLALAQADPGTAAAPGTDLQRLQVIKGWIGEDGDHHQRIFEVAGSPNNGASVRLDSCEPVGKGHRDLCAVWQDPEFDASKRAVYYVRAIENPTCRYSTRDCNSLAPADRPAACDDPNYPKTIQERAWSSPIWYSPAGS